MEIAIEAFGTQHCSREARMGFFGQRVGDASDNQPAILSGFLLISAIWGTYRFAGWPAGPVYDPARLRPGD